MRLLALSVPLLMFSACSNALTCIGNVSKIDTLYTGIVRVTSSSGLPSKAYLCNTNGSWGGISSDTCKTWISYAQVAQTSGQELEITYSGVTETDCATLPINSASYVPYIVSLSK